MKLLTLSRHRATALLAMSLIPLCLLSLPEAASADRSEAAPRKVLRVKCDSPGHSLARAISRARSGQIIKVSGTCNERVVIAAGPLEIRGVNGAVIDGASLPLAADDLEGLVTITGATGIVLRNLTIRNYGVAVHAGTGSAVQLEGIRVSGHQRGLLLTSATARLYGIHIEGGATGVQATAGSSLLVTGDVEVHGTSNEAFSLLGATGELRGGLLDIHDNFGLGLAVVANSTLTLLGFPASANTHVLVRGNHGPGILLANGTLEFGGTEPISPLVEVTDNLGPGIVLTSGARLASAVGWARVVSSRNALGLAAEAGSTVWMQGGLEITGNFGPGIAASDSSLVLAPGINPVVIEQNAAPDVILEFGARSSLAAGVVVGTPLVCDSTVLSRGAIVCP